MVNASFQSYLQSSLLMENLATGPFILPIALPTSNSSSSTAPYTNATYIFLTDPYLIAFVNLVADSEFLAKNKIPEV